ncbi:hypothetical protein ACUSIJ_04000 [Pseudochelatococcus sp. B33]
MMDFEGEACLALWNGIEGRREAEYNVWHAREHVPQRLTVPGMRSARRYRKVIGPLADYLTLYDAAELKVFETDTYRRLLEHPTPWSRSMRPSFRGFFRLCCRRIVSHGGGLGTAVAAGVLGEIDFSDRGTGQELKQLLHEHCLTAVHLLQRDRNVAEAPFSIDREVSNLPDAGALLLESFDEDCLRETLGVVSDSLLDMGFGTFLSTATLYRLVSALDRGSLAKGLPFQAAGHMFRPDHADDSNPQP